MAWRKDSRLRTGIFKKMLVIKIEGLWKDGRLRSGILTKEVHKEKCIMEGWQMKGI